MASIPLYTALLPTILCQQPAVILHWLKTERATGNLPVEIALDCIVELLSRQTIPSQPSEYSKVFVDSLLGELGTANHQLEVYKRALNLMRTYAAVIVTHGCNCDECALASKVMDALNAVDALEGN